jgi:Cu/Ag efflux protein CusF
MLSIKNRIALMCLTAGVILTGCSSSSAPGQAKAPNSAAVKQYPMRGKIMGLDAAQHTASINAEEIPGFMGAMTMGYTIKDPVEFSKLKVGDAITATVNVQGDDMWVNNIKPDSGAKP